MEKVYQSVTIYKFLDEVMFCRSCVNLNKIIQKLGKI